MVAISFALGSSMLWGLADYFAGLRSRSYPVPVVLAAMYVTSLVTMALFVWARGEGPPTGSSLVAAFGAGAVGITSLAMFYRALAIGTMSIVAPITAAGVCVPVLVGMAGGDQPSAVRCAGMALAIIGIVLASRSQSGREAPRAGGRGPTSRRGRVVVADPSRRRLSILLAVIAGIGFGSHLVLSQIAASGDVEWTLLLGRVCAVPLIGVFAWTALQRGGRRPSGRAVLALGALGLVDLAANACYNYATTIGELSSVGVAGSLYPVMTVGLAALLLGERVPWVGVGMAMLGLVMIGAGG
jgi:drug/metabolite transporter (DMT)-like permease